MTGDVRTVSIMHAHPLLLLSRAIEAAAAELPRVPVLAIYGRLPADSLPNKRN